MAKFKLALNLNIDVQSPDSLIFSQKPFIFTENGTFREGDLAINKNGMLIKGESPIKSPATSPRLRSETPSKSSGYSLADFEVLKTLGQGSAGVVRKVIHAPTHQLAALKQVALDVSENVRKQIIMELKILHSSKSDFIVSLFDAYYMEGSIYIALEYMDAGSLADLLVAKKRLSEAVLATVTYQALKGLTYLQKDLHIVHRDIKPSNILLNTKGQVKIADFGVSGLLANTGARAVTWVGTVTYMSPERIQGAAYSTNSDIWALGLTLLECALGKYPYASVNAETGQPISFFELLSVVVNSPVPTMPTDKFSPEFCDFITSCLIKDPSVRPNPDVLLNHPFIQKHVKNLFNLASYVKSLDAGDDSF